MQHKTVARALIGMVVLLAWACADQNVAPALSTKEVSVVNGRVAFSSEASFLKISNDLFNLSQYDQMKWAKSLGHASMIDNAEMREGEAFRIFSPIQKLYLNQSGLVQVGDDVILHRAGIQYYMNARDYDALADLEDITKSDRRGEFGVLESSAELEEAARAFTAYINNGGFIGTGGDQVEFSLVDGSQRKFVVEFTGYYSQYGQNGEYCPGGGPWFAGDWSVQLYMDSKLEGRANSRRSWSRADDIRSFTWNLNFTAIKALGYTSCNVATDFPQTDVNSVGDNVNFAAGFYRIPVKSAVCRSYNHPYAWTGDVTGTVRHQYYYPGDQNYQDIYRSF